MPIWVSQAIPACLALLVSPHLSKPIRHFSTAKLGAVPQCLPPGLIVPMALLSLTPSSGLAESGVAMIPGGAARQGRN